MTDLRRSHAELRAAVILAGKETGTWTLGELSKEAVVEIRFALLFS